MWTTAMTLRGQIVMGSSLFNAEALATFVVDGLLLLVNLALLYFILRHLVYKPIFKMIDERRGKIEAELAQAAQHEAEARKKEQEAREKLESAVNEAVRVVGEAKSKARIESEQILKTARTEALAIQERGRAEQARLHQQMLSELREEISDLALSIAGRVIGEAMTGEAQRQMVEKLLDERLQDDASAL